MTDKTHRALVTGSTGFVGRRLVARLKRSGYAVRTISRHGGDDADSVQFDLMNGELPAETFDDVDVVFHLAGYAHDLRDESEAEVAYRNLNVEATRKLVEQSAASGVSAFVYVSSVKAGGSDSKGEPGTCIAEDDSGAPEGLYGRTKREAEEIVLRVGEGSEMFVSVVRPTLVYGPGVKGNLAAMRTWIQRGVFPPLPETGNRRSMVHVEDLCEALMLASGEPRARGGIFNVTDGQLYSSAQIYAAMCHAVGKMPPSWSVPRSLFDLLARLSPRLEFRVNKLLGDECYSSARLEALGFKARFTLWNIDESID